MKPALVVLATLAVLLLLALVFPYTGLYNVSAAEGHTGLARWLLQTTQRNSVQARADDVEVPADLADSTLALRGALAFDQMCVVCHGAPGVDRGVIGQGITPQPPRLSEAATMWEPGEVYWILHEGIKLAGMPAFGPTHTDEELWEITAFVERLPEMTPDQYAAWVSAAGGTAPDTSAGQPPDGHDHTH